MRGLGALRPVRHPAERARKFRQAAIVYLHYGLLYLFGAYVLVERDLFPDARGPEWMWFGTGIAIGAVVVWGLWWWQSPWFARAVWLLVALRLPTLIEGAFLGGAIDLAPGLYLMAGLVVLANLVFLARAAWDV
ncbi:MAG TPA: hypothetical protein VG799_00370 [Gemmatimonadota bacterium]|nr:hypothetical protein [Gemmatimonadota bacterium]